VFDLTYLWAIPNRMYGIMTNELLVAVPLFIFMGVVLERSNVAHGLLKGMTHLLGNRRGGLGFAVILVGALLAASTGIVGATVVTMGMICLPTMLKEGYDPKIATGSICAAGTLGQIIPPSIVLILLGDQISNAYQVAQLKLGNLSPEPLSLSDVFMGALLPGMALVALYLLWIVVYGFFRPNAMPPYDDHEAVSFKQSMMAFLPPLALIIVVLGSILSGVATVTESASMGAVGALFLALIYRQLSWKMLGYVVRSTATSTSMIFTILIGATIFSLVFRGLGGDELVKEFLTGLPGGVITAMIATMLLMFVLGFFLDFIEIIFVVVPIIGPVLLLMGVNPLWLAVMIAMNLQTSFLTPPFGFSLFYLRGVAPKTVKTTDIYRGALPFVVIQLALLGMLALYPSWVTYLPEALYGTSFETIQPSFSPSAAQGMEYDSDGVDF
jgi:tripartite ATP-independent transporter DctM subunit